jgi:hypothetical protein
MLYTGERLPPFPITEATPRIRNIHLETIKISSGRSYAVELLGLPEMVIEDVTFDGIVAQSEKGMNLSDVKGIRFKDCDIKAGTAPLVKVTDGRCIIFDSLVFPVRGGQLLRVDGAKSGGIKIRRMDVRNADQDIELGPDVPKDAVIIEE